MAEDSFEGWPSIEDIANSVKTGDKNAVYWAEKALAACEKYKDYNALITVSNIALEVAKTVDEKIAKGEEVGRLAGVPYIAKDNFLTKDVRTTAASNILSNFIPPYSATVIKRLEDEGAVLIAKANLDSFAHGGSTEYSDMGVTKNPIDKERVPGGSSGGSAASVVLGLAAFALGTDTGGSIRLPASFTGSVGLKPTYGLVSRYGVVAMASSTDVIGPMTRTVSDCAYVLDVMAGKDSYDSTTIERDEMAYTHTDDMPLKGKTIGYIKEHLSDAVAPGVVKVIKDSLEKAKAAGAEVKEISLPMIDYALAVYYIIVPAEISSNLSRYDGIRYGYSAENAKDLEEVYSRSRTEGFNDEVKRRIILGTYVLSSGYYDAYYKKAQQVRTLITEEMNKAFSEVDFLAGPVAPTTAYKIGEKIDDPLKMYLIDDMTTPVNLAGLPAISVPVGKDENGLPVGLQIIANAREDRKLLEVAKEMEGLSNGN